MPDRIGFLSRSVDLLRLCDPFSDEAAQVFLRSEVLELYISTTVRFCSMNRFIERGTNS